MDDTMIEGYSEQTDEDQTPQVMTPEAIMSIIDRYIGNEVIIISQDDWVKFVDIWKASPDKDLEDKMIAAEVGVMPLSIGPAENKEESRIIMPDSTPHGDIRIVKP